jgi:hypothetical protein
VNECCICSCPLYTENPKHFFCPKCYHDWNREIKAGVAWVKYLESVESARRRQDTYTKNGKRVAVQFIYLGDEYDLSEDGQVIPLAEHYKENQ